jgi:hypothetical protein
MKRLFLVLTIVMGMFLMASCSKDDDNSTNPTKKVDPWVGTWLSAGANVSTILSYYFKYDSIRVEMKDNQVVTLATHVTGGAWANVSGTYVVTKSTSGDVHAISIVYPTYEQGGIIKVVDAAVDTMKMEVVQTVPSIGATPRTPATGFGSDTSLLNANIQTYIKLK